MSRRVDVPWYVTGTSVSPLDGKFFSIHIFYFGSFSMALSFFVVCRRFMLFRVSDCVSSGNCGVKGTDRKLDIPTSSGKRTSDRSAILFLLPLRELFNELFLSS